MATILQNIKRIRAKQGLTQDDLAKKANINTLHLPKLRTVSLPNQAFKLYRKSPSR